MSVLLNVLCGSGICRGFFSPAVRLILFLLVWACSLGKCFFWILPRSVPISLCHAESTLSAWGMAMLGAARLTRRSLNDERAGVWVSLTTWLSITWKGEPDEKEKRRARRAKRDAKEDRDAKEGNNEGAETGGDAGAKEKTD
jgi:hypothetical protein